METINFMQLTSLVLGSPRTTGLQLMHQNKWLRRHSTHDLEDTLFTNVNIFIAYKRTKSAYGKTSEGAEKVVPRLMQGYFPALVTIRRAVCNQGIIDLDFCQMEVKTGGGTFLEELPNLRLHTFSEKILSLFAGFWLGLKVNTTQDYLWRYVSDFTVALFKDSDRNTSIKAEYRDLPLAGQAQGFRQGKRRNNRLIEYKISTIKIYYSLLVSPRIKIRSTEFWIFCHYLMRLKTFHPKTVRTYSIRFFLLFLLSSRPSVESRGIRRRSCKIIGKVKKTAMWL